MKQVKIPTLFINFKNYAEGRSAKGMDLARAAEAAARATGASVVVAPPTVMLSEVASSIVLPVFAQHVDPVDEESSTGFVTPASLAEVGCYGSILNHSEHRLPQSDVFRAVNMLKECGLLSLVCARDPAEAGALARLDPDFIAVEPPELIGKGRAVSKVSPEVVVRAVEEIDRVNPRTIPLCGAGIVDPADVTESIRLGARGVLVSSSIVKNMNRYEKIYDLCRALTV